MWEHIAECVLLFTAWIHLPTCATTPISGIRFMDSCRTHL
jgi:hypothetical protein